MENQNNSSQAAPKKHTFIIEVDLTEERKGLVTGLAKSKVHGGAREITAALVQLMRENENVRAILTIAVNEMKIDRSDEQLVGLLKCLGDLTKLMDQTK
jgi:hypothetical protein